MILITIVLIVWAIAFRLPSSSPPTRPDPEPIQGALVFPGAPGDAGLLRSLAGGGGLSHADHRGPHGDPLHRQEPQGKRLLQLRRAPSGDHALPVRLPHPLGASAPPSGTFLRGPNWNFFGPYEFWDTHKLEALVNVNLSDYFWVKLLNRPLPANPLIREVWGVLMTLAYVFVLPVLLAKPWDKAPRWLRWMSLNKYFKKMGPARYYVGVSLFLLMLSLPIKMYLRWAFNLKYIVAFPEIFFNI